MVVKGCASALPTNTGGTPVLHFSLTATPHYALQEWRVAAPILFESIGSGNDSQRLYCIQRFSAFSAVRVPSYTNTLKFRMYFLPGLSTHDLS